jgi:putative transcriptional regulator
MIVWKLDELLRKRGIKGRELAKAMAIGENYLSRVRHEAPDRLSLSLLDALCRELDCTIADLLEYKPMGKVKPAKRPKPEPKVITDEELLAAVAEAFASDGDEQEAAAPTEVEAAKPTETVVLKTSSLQAKLKRLKRLRER